jgi:hypothetical protein
MGEFIWSHTTPETCPYIVFEMWHLGARGTQHQYRVVRRRTHRQDVYAAEKNGKILGEFAKLEDAQRCLEASAHRAVRHAMRNKRGEP